MNRLAWVLVVCLLLAGCAATGPETNRTTTAGILDEPTVDFSATPTADAPVRTPRRGTRATVTRVVDGDTVEIRYANGTTDTVRLLGVDTPEVHVPNTPAEYEGVPDTERGEACLRDAGHDASDALTRTAEGATVRLIERGRGRYDRLLAFVFLDERTINYRLVAQGYARVYDSDFEGRDRFYRAESRARRAHRGLWRCANRSEQRESEPQTSLERDGRGSLAVVTVTADAPGNDNANPNGESVVFENTGRRVLELGGWTVSDEADHAYTFSAGFSLDPGARVALHTGRGADTRTDRYWGATSAVWNNDGDTITVRNADGAVVIRRSYA